MALTRGLKGNFPCPVCLVPNKLQSKLEIVHPRRNVDAVRSIVLDKSLNKSQKEDQLKLLSSRDVEVSLASVSFDQFPNIIKNAFWDVEHSDPADALAFDRLHFNHGGVFSDHLFEEFQCIADSIGRDAMGAIDRLYAIC